MKTQYSYLNFPTSFRFSDLYLPLILGLLFSLSAFGQTEINKNGFVIESKTILIENSSTNNVEISWDFSNSTNRTATTLNIEVQPINDCWNTLNGKNRSDMVLKTFKNLAENPTGNLLLSSREYNTKCFKWRAQIINTNTRQEQYTDWQFSSFL
ncbi:hypothetical protein DFQ11_104131 [Winogradskyella epiphytica]|uniref:Uncharacterized protein n=1 Tax=Winogradskyella epiphytica TaxID=262005 RepID=A0A2V4XE81_9FLAO|nr:hypothetical protein [Winogradskyella epiphytica]PYE80764.1 hypothetical protein DFQ11_104131 [Winogradskyella epiphytica]GGW68300.1 hypothetical protein GCM10008085_20280 [Winogradskyella epiphytica]